MPKRKAEELSADAKIDLPAEVYTSIWESRNNEKQIDLKPIASFRLVSSARKRAFELSQGWTFTPERRRIMQVRVSSDTDSKAGSFRSSIFSTIEKCSR